MARTTDDDSTEELDGKTALAYIDAWDDIESVRGVVDTECIDGRLLVSADHDANAFAAKGIRFAAIESDIYKYLNSYDAEEFDDDADLAKRVTNVHVLVETEDN